MHILLCSHMKDIFYIQRGDCIKNAFDLVPEEFYLSGIRTSYLQKYKQSAIEHKVATYF